VNREPPRRRRLTGSRSLKFALTLRLLVGVEALPAADAIPGEWKTEFKFIVPAANMAKAIQVLQLDEQRAVKGIVCFFDTGDRALEANNLILRARQRDGQSGDSTVKLRAPSGGMELSAPERLIAPEHDWTNDHEPTISRSLDARPISKGLVARVAEGDAAVVELYNHAQRQLVAARLKDFDWGDLKCYGPVEAEVWPQQSKLPGFLEPVTVELWHLRQAGRTQDLLEVSTKSRVETDAQAQALARQFFTAATAAGLGEPATQTKTKQVLDFFKPGKQ
jgi:hypothetical protein